MRKKNAIRALKIVLGFHCLKDYEDKKFCLEEQMLLCKGMKSWA